jgi:heptosyltransferase-2
MIAAYDRTMSAILVIKTGALGDVLRTTSILPGLRKSVPDASVTWITAPAAVDLLRTNPLVDEVVALDPQNKSAVEAVIAKLGPRDFERVVSLDDEVPLCRLASRMKTTRLSGAFERLDGTRAYTPDVAPWFDMGLLSVHGKARADELKIVNTKSQPRIYADMLRIEMSKPMLRLPEDATAFARDFERRHGLGGDVRVIGLNTGAGGRWTSKQLPVERTVALARLLAHDLGRRVRFLVLGGATEVERNRAILAELAENGLRDVAVDAGCDNALLPFASLVGLCNVLVTSDSLALHMAIALDVRTVAFFAPTSAAEIELYGLGEKVVSTAPDYCSYRADADNSSITPERLRDAVVRQLRAAH